MLDVESTYLALFTCHPALVCIIRRILGVDPFVILIEGPVIAFHFNVEVFVSWHRRVSG